MPNEVDCTDRSYSVCSNYSILCEGLEQINAETRDEYGQKAGGYRAQMEKLSTSFGLKLSHLIFSGIEQLAVFDFAR